MAESGTLLRCYTGNRIEGSNPSASAINIAMNVTIVGGGIIGASTAYFLSGAWNNSGTELDDCVCLDSRQNGALCELRSFVCAKYVLLC